METDTTFALTWNGRPTNELHPDNPTTVTIKQGTTDVRFSLRAARDDDDPRVYNQRVKADVVARLGTLEFREQLIVFDDEPLPTLTLSAPDRVVEGDTFTVTATLSHRLDVDTKVTYYMWNPSKMDIRGLNGIYPTIGIAAGQLSGQSGNLHKQNDDDTDGWGELSFSINSISPYQWRGSSDRANVRVTDDDGTDPTKRRYSGWPRLYAGDVWGDESGDPNVDSTITFSVTLYPTSRSTVTVDYRTVDGSAKAGVNYRSKSGTLTFAPREKRQTVTVDVMDDGQGPSTEFQLVFNGPHGGGAEVGDYWVTGRIYDETPTFRSWDESARESGNGTETQMNFYVSLHHAADDETYTIDYTTVGRQRPSGHRLHGHERDADLRPGREVLSAGDGPNPRRRRPRQRRAVLAGVIKPHRGRSTTPPAPHRQGNHPQRGRPRRIRQFPKPARIRPVPIPAPATPPRSWWPSASPSPHLPRPRHQCWSTARPSPQ